MESTKKIVCYGEVLWDMLPNGKVVGGAPMNVAFQAGNLGLKASLISRVGEDELGKELLEFLSEKGLKSDLIQVDLDHLTGIVKVQLSAGGQPSYEIVHPVAWDFIEVNPALAAVVRAADLFVFGSLVARSSVSRETLFQLLDVAPFRAFDVNLREPFYSKELLDPLLTKADLVKVNDDELEILANWYSVRGNQQEQMTQLRRQFGWEGIICTLGKDGACYLDNKGWYQQGGFPIQVQDTIGSGDAFFATFLWAMATGADPNECLKKGSAAGALVATQSGATNRLSAFQIEQFIGERGS